MSGIHDARRDIAFTCPTLVFFYECGKPRLTLNSVFHFLIYLFPLRRRPPCINFPDQVLHLLLI